MMEAKVTCKECGGKVHLLKCQQSWIDDEKSIIVGCDCGRRFKYVISEVIELSPPKFELESPRERTLKAWDEVQDEQ